MSRTALLTVKDCEEIGHAFDESQVSIPRLLKITGYARKSDTLFVAKDTRGCRYCGLIQHRDSPISGSWLSPEEYEAAIAETGED